MTWFLAQLEITVRQPAEPFLPAPVMREVET
jgi:hypothetical protein